MESDCFESCFLQYRSMSRNHFCNSAGEPIHLQAMRMLQTFAKLIASTTNSSLCFNVFNKYYTMLFASKQSSLKGFNWDKADSKRG